VEEGKKLGGGEVSGKDIVGTGGISESITRAFKSIIGIAVCDPSSDSPRKQIGTSICAPIRTGNGLLVHDAMTYRSTSAMSNHVLPGAANGRSRTTFRFIGLGFVHHLGLRALAWS